MYSVHHLHKNYFQKFSVVLHKNYCFSFFGNDEDYSIFKYKRNLTLSLKLGIRLTTTSKK